MFILGIFLRFSIVGSFIVKMQKSRFLFRRNKKFSSGSISDHRQVALMTIQLSINQINYINPQRSVPSKHSSKHSSPPMQSVSLDNSSGSGRSRLNILRKNIFRRRHRKNNESKWVPNQISSHFMFCFSFCSIVGLLKVSLQNVIYWLILIQ